jgi:hypothetical protein
MRFGTRHASFCEEQKSSEISSPDESPSGGGTLMNCKSILLAVALASFGATMSFESALANSKHDQMTGRFLTSPGCQRQNNVLKAMSRQPGRWGQPAPSLASQYR